jgi:hypothetical protein
VLSISMVLGLCSAAKLIAQDGKQDQSKPEQKPAEKVDAKPDQKPAETTEKKDGAAKPAEKPAEAPAPPPLKPVPPEVEQKLEAARRAVAEAIVAAQDAGLVDTTVEPPPILDILILGQANDRAVLKAKLDELKANPNASPEAGLSVEVFGAWFSSQGAMEGVDLQKNIRIMNPSKGLVDWYAKRADILNRHIAEVRKAKGTAEPAKGADTKAEETKANETGKPADEKKDDTAKPAEESKPAENAKPAEEKKDEPKPAEDKPAEEKKG